jgi:hypothetical protein
MITVNGINSGAVLRFTRLGGGVVRVTRAYFDPFDSDYDHETLEGDFLWSDLEEVVQTLEDPRTGAIAIPAPPKKRWWQRG